MKVGYATILKHNGEEHTVTEWSEIKGISRDTIVSRINQFGWSVADAIETKANKPRAKKRRCDANCRDCQYSMWLSWDGRYCVCDYLGMTGKRRPCEAGDGCTVKEKLNGKRRKVRPDGGKVWL